MQVSEETRDLKQERAAAQAQQPRRDAAESAHTGVALQQQAQAHEARASGDAHAQNGAANQCNQNGAANRCNQDSPPADRSLRNAPCSPRQCSGRGPEEWVARVQFDRVLAEKERLEADVGYLERQRTDLRVSATNQLKHLDEELQGLRLQTLELGRALSEEESQGEDERTDGMRQPLPRTPETDGGKDEETQEVHVRLEAVQQQLEAANASLLEAVSRVHRLEREVEEGERQAMGVQAEADQVRMRCAAVQRQLEEREKELQHLRSPSPPGHLGGRTTELLGSPTPAELFGSPTPALPHLVSPGTPGRAQQAWAHVAHEIEAVLHQVLDALPPPPDFSQGDVSLSREQSGLDAADVGKSAAVGQQAGRDGWLALLRVTQEVQGLTGSKRRDLPAAVRATEGGQELWASLALLASAVELVLREFSQELAYACSTAGRDARLPRLPPEADACDSDQVEVQQRQMESPDAPSAGVRAPAFSSFAMSPDTLGAQGDCRGLFLGSSSAASPAGKGSPLHLRQLAPTPPSVPAPRLTVGEEFYGDVRQAFNGGNALVEGVLGRISSLLARQEERLRHLDEATSICRMAAARRVQRTVRSPAHAQDDEMMDASLPHCIHASDASQAHWMRLPAASHQHAGARNADFLSQTAGPRAAGAEGVLSASEAGFGNQGKRGSVRRNAMVNELAEVMGERDAALKAAGEAKRACDVWHSRYQAATGDLAFSQVLSLSVCDSVPREHRGLT